MKWVIVVALFSPILCFAQIPIPITPDWLRGGGEKESAILHSTHVQLTDGNYRILQTNVIGRSRGFRILGLITIKPPSYVKAVSQVYAQAGVEEGRPQVLANVVYETGGLNLIVFSFPQVRVRADLIEFLDIYEEHEHDGAVPVRARQRHRQR